MDFLADLQETVQGAAVLQQPHSGGIRVA
ncbi:hypothetical protein CCACVL1_18945 [Corchorus capsularis]|uniref:Uncharacterized protein n=1 Tax=Corchorus capsularis TaxID=210143 RepID=A0A1R3HJ72_COCAP|nr:hypothetical protein CCACVL1_18945 [Corchorus capsularis]